MPAAESGGTVALVPRSLTPTEKLAARAAVAGALPFLSSLLEAAQSAADGPDPEAAFVFLGMMTARISSVLFPL